MSLRPWLPGPYNIQFTTHRSIDTVRVMAAVKVPTAAEIRQLLEEKKRKADVVQKQIDKATGEAAQKSLELIAAENKALELSGQLDTLRTENAKLKDRKKSDPTQMRGMLDAVIKKHACEPADELLRMVTEQTQVLDRQGNPAFTDDGQPMLRYVLDAELRSTILLKLMEFRMPKLRGMEINGKMDVNHQVVIVRFGDQEMKPVKVIDT